MREKCNNKNPGFLVSPESLPKTMRVLVPSFDTINKYISGARSYVVSLPRPLFFLLTLCRGKKRSGQRVSDVTYAYGSDV